MIQIGFHGAAKTVTGSNYLIKTSVGNFVVDCGMFQGEDVEALNLEEFAYNPAEVDFVLLTHAHIDHCGMLPKLVKHGFKGQIYATPNTIQISNLLLLDSAKIQENNYKRGEFFGKHTPIVALVYNMNDAEQTINQFVGKRFGDTFEPVPGIQIKFIRAGHVLGAASIEVNVFEGEKKTKMLFSGDIGRVEQTLIESFDTEYKAKPDYVVMESLYGGQVHPRREESVLEMVGYINETIKRGGNVYIPSFAVQRTQEILHDIRMLKAEGRLDENVPVYLDSPLAQKVSNLYMSALQHTPEALFDSPNLRYVKKHQESLALDRKSGQIIIAGSGMADGGRIVEHLAQGLRSKKNAVLFVGFQAEGTLGRELVDGAKTVSINKTTIKVEADIHFLKGFSAHGDTNDYMSWLKRFNSQNLKKIFLVHAEPERSAAFKASLEQEGINQAVVPQLHEELNLE